MTTDLNHWDTSTSLSIRSYRPIDLNALIGIFLGAIHEIAARDYSPAQIAAWAQVDRERFAADRLSRPTWTATLDRLPVGFSDLEPDGHLDMMYVHPARQGRGTASALLEQVETVARAQALSRIFTEASITAKPFFERRGFRTIAAQQVGHRGQTLTNFRMEKFLS